MKMALIDLELVRQSKEQNEEETFKYLYLLSGRAEVFFLSSKASEQTQIQRWVEENRLDKHKTIHHEEQTRESFVIGLIQRMDAGKSPPAEEVIFVDSDEQTRLDVFDRHALRITIYKSLKDAVEEQGPPAQSQEMSWSDRILLVRKALED